MHTPIRSRGFTLIEILVVVIIIGTVMSIAVLSLNLASDDRDLQTEARRFMSLVEVVQDEAMVQGRTDSLNMTPWQRSGPRCPSTTR